MARPPRRIIRSTHLLRMSPILSPHRAESDFGAHRGRSGGAREAIGHAPDPAGAVERMRAARKAQAGLFAANVLPTIPEVQAAGYTSFNAIAGQLNARRSLATGCQDFGSPFVSNHVSVLRKWARVSPAISAAATVAEHAFAA